MGSIAYWGWIAVRGNSDDSPVELTKTGQEQLKIYTQATLNERSKEGDLTERCMRLLRHSRKAFSIVPKKVA